jgi:Flp pilus assembly protein CpaB
MRASTLLGLGLALVIGLVVVAGIRFSGVFSRTPPSPPPPEPKPVMVLAAKDNLYMGTSATSLNVGLREATKEERELVLDDRKQGYKTYLPPVVEAAHLRKLKRNVAVNALLQRDDFEQMELPEAVAARLSPGMRAVDVELPKERAGAGLLRLGERVDVFLTSKISTDLAGSNARTAIAPIAKDVKIVVKRDILYTLMIPVPEDKPVSFILEANPYRAALIEYSKTKGLITLVATSSKGKEPNPSDAEREQDLIDRFVNGDASVNETDLERIFRLPMLPALPQPLRVEMYEAGKLTNTTLVQAPVPARLERNEGGYHFFIPSEGSQMTPRHDGAKKDGPPNIGVRPTPPKKK